MTLTKNDLWKYGSVTVSPFDWFEASYFYFRPSDLKWGQDVGKFLDKGINVKFILNTNNKTQYALGINDLAGTGTFSSEYIVATSKYNKLKISYGMGWGKYVGNENFENPLGSFNKKFNFRPGGYSESGGVLEDQKWFRGDVSFFGGVEYKIPYKNLKIKAEYFPASYYSFGCCGEGVSQKSEELRKNKTNFNVGISYPFKYGNIELGLINKNSINLSYNFGLNFKRNKIKKDEFKPRITIKDFETNNKKDSFYLNLLENLNKNGLFLQTAELNDEEVKLAISTSEHRNHIRSSSYVASITSSIARDINIPINSIEVTHVNVGIELNKVNYLNESLVKKNEPIEITKRHTQLKPGMPGNFLKNEFVPNINFPVIFSGFSPRIVSHIGSPRKFYYGGLALNHSSEIQFKRNVLLSTSINYLLSDYFKNTISNPDSNLPHVRTDLVSYLDQDKPTIEKFQLDYIHSYKKNFFSKFSIGIFEQMYGGFGGQLLYKPFNENFYSGIDLFYVKKRKFNQLFGYQNYKTLTGHLNFGYHHQSSGIKIKLSTGRYLAKDNGFTVDLSRESRSGFKTGFFATFTNVPSEEFGEGSFNKGFYFQIPLDLLSNKHSRNVFDFNLSPLTRDGGAKLRFDKDLTGLIHNSSYKSFEIDWSGYLN